MSTGDPRVVAIDGPSGSGKSTLARALAERLSLSYLDTGAMYRAVALAVLEEGLDVGDEAAVTALAASVVVDAGERVTLEGRDVTAEIRTTEVTAAASVVATYPGVRSSLVRRQQEWIAVHGGGVVEGRDIASVVFPAAELKLFLTARADERARRRAREVGGEERATGNEMAERDRRDAARTRSPLVKTDDAVEIDTSDRTVEAVVDEVLGLLDGGARSRDAPVADSPEAPDSGSRRAPVPESPVAPAAGTGVTRLDRRVGTRFSYKLPTRASLVVFAVCRLIAVTVCRLFCRVTVEGRENLPRSVPYVLAPVHRSYVDWIVLGCISRRRIRFMAKDTLWSSRVVGWLLESLGTFPVHRGSADRAAFSMCVAILQEGEPCVMFPEGQRMSGPVVADLFDGAAYVAARAGVAVVPVGIGGSERVMQKGKILPRPYKIHIIVGEPIPPPVAGTGGRVARRAVKEATETLQERIQQLFDRAQLRAGVEAPDSGTR